MTDRLDRRPTPRPPIVFGQPQVGDAAVEEVVATLRSGWLGPGPRVAAFEESFRGRVGSGRAVALSSCSAGLFLALHVAGIGPGDEVVTTPLTFAATVHAIEHVGATPVLADIDPSSYNIDPAAVAAVITSRTRAIVPVHFAGRPCAMDELQELARRHDLLVIEDAAHAFGARYRGRAVGTLSDATAFSFQAGKNLTTGEGGMLTTERDDWATQVRVLSRHGMSADAWSTYREHQDVPVAVMAGHKLAMTDLQAAIGIHELAAFDARQARRATIWSCYDALLAGLPVTTPPPPEPDTEHALHLYSVLLDLEQLGRDRGREEVRHALRTAGVGTGVHYVPVHLHPHYQGRLGPIGSFPHAERVGARTVSLPLNHHLSDDDVEFVAGALRAAVTA